MKKWHKYRVPHASSVYTANAHSRKHAAELPSGLQNFCPAAANKQKQLQKNDSGDTIAHDALVSMITQQKRGITEFITDQAGDGPAYFILLTKGEKSMTNKFHSSKTTHATVGRNASMSLSAPQP